METGRDFLELRKDGNRVKREGERERGRETKEIGRKGSIELSNRSTWQTKKHTEGLTKTNKFIIVRSTGM